MEVGVGMALVYNHGKEFHIQTQVGDVGEYVILPGDPGRCKKIAEYLENPIKVAENREYVTYTGTLDGVKVSVTSTGIGGPSAAIALEELIHCGAKTFIRVGTSGGMQPEVCGGDFVIATGAIRAEGTSKEYLPIEFPAVSDFEVTKALEMSAKKFLAKENVGKVEEEKQRVHLGVVQCKDNFYGQHDPNSMPVASELNQKWQAWIAGGALASEMESSALFIVASARRVRIGTVLLVLANQTRRELGLPDRQVYDTDGAIKIAIGAIKELIKEKNDTEYK